MQTSDGAIGPVNDRELRASGELVLAMAYKFNLPIREFHVQPAFAHQDLDALTAVLVHAGDLFRFGRSDGHPGLFCAGFGSRCPTNSSTFSAVAGRDAPLRFVWTITAKRCAGIIRISDPYPVHNPPCCTK